MSADLLARAAKRLRDYARVATSSPPEQPWTAFDSGPLPGRDRLIRVERRWVPEEDDDPGECLVADLSVHTDEGWPVGQAVVDAEYIALMHPPVGLALATAFERFAWMIGLDLPNLGYRVGCDEMFTLAREILREHEPEGNRDA